MMVQERTRRADAPANKLVNRYLSFDGQRLNASAGAIEGAEVSPLADFVHASFRGLILNPRFVCVAARSAFQRNNYRFSVYNHDLGTPEAAQQLASDLERFVSEQDTDLKERGFSTFVASFAGPVTATETEFEQRLWDQLQLLHETDSKRHEWDASVSADPEDAHFEFSVGGRAFFVVGLHPASSRLVRKFTFPTLVFNAHFQFDELRASGKFDRMQSVIRSRDLTLQGSINPNLAHFGERSDARQYAGRSVEDGWKCPFHALWASDGIDELNHGTDAKDLNG